ncbi:sialin isoform X3 [Penaeus vannamei]|uniref:sialin isoform X3 n=1 Tax=Penaeus vannamei TaxID=6689 RepID=UPI00387F7781
MRGKNGARWWPRILSYTGSSPVSDQHKLITKDVENTLPEEPRKSKFGERHVLITLLFFGFAVVYAMRVNLSVAIVAMVKNRPHTKKVSQEYDDTCPLPATQKSKDAAMETNGEFDWDEQTQGMVLGCFFYGYLLTNYIGGRLAERFGGRLVYGLGVTLTAALTVISPYAARHSTSAFVFIRILEGMTEGVTFPAMNVMMSYWIPPQERARSLTQSVGGCQFGTVVTLSISGWLSQTEWGWPSVFYLFGVLGLVWGYFWFRYAYDSPDQHPRITAAEKLFIKQGIGDHRKSESLPVPWHSILTSTPFVVVMVTHVGNNWGFYCLLTELPTYLKNMQHYDMKEELAPNFAGTLTGISNTLATIPGFLAPEVTGAIINNQQTLSRWKEVFQLVSVVYFIVCTLYLIFMSPEVQPWNEGHTEKRYKWFGRKHVKL